MSLLSTKGIYGLAAMYELSKSPNKIPMQNKDICKKANVPQNYLEQLLPLLKKAGLIKSIRGAQGGYYLVRSPSLISIKDIFIALEGSLQICSCESVGLYKLFYEECDKKLQILFDMPLDKLKEYEDEILGQINYVI